MHDSDSVESRKREMKVQKDPTKRLKSEKSWGPSRSGTEEEKVSEFEDIVKNGWYETEGKRPKKKWRTTVDCGKITGGLKYVYLMS